MDNTITPISATTQQYKAPAVKASGPSLASEAQGASPAPQQETGAPNTSSSYEATLRQAALSFKDVYAVSDQQFSIFKDATGQFITRYVSLRDGKVTYVPEPVLVKPLQLAGDQLPPKVAINV